MSQPCCYRCEACLSPLPPSDESKQEPQQQQQAATPPSSSDVTTSTSTSSHPPAQAPPLLPASLVPAGMEESFILLAGEASQMCVGRGDRRPGAAASGPSAAEAAAPPKGATRRSYIPRTPLDAHFRSLAAAFEVSASVAASSDKERSSGGGGGGEASTPSAEASPPPSMLLCSDCASRVAAELDAEAEAALEDARAAEEALAVLRAEAEREAKDERSPAPSPEEARARAAAARKRASDAAASLEAAARDAARAAADARATSALEARYWLELDAALSSASSAADDAAATLARAERAAASLEGLRSRDAVCDLHRIWYHDERASGPAGGDGGEPGSSYATVGGCRAGKGAGLGWDEANAALGSAARLLATLFRLHCAGDDEGDEGGEGGRDSRRRRRRFLSSPSKVRLLPAGSTARVSDARTGTVHDLFGPVNKLYCASFDRGMALLAVGVREFAVAAAESDRARLGGEAAGGATPEDERPFSVPYEITPDGDRVGGLSLRLMLNKDARWTRAVKYLMADLKCCAAWSATERARWRREEGEGGEARAREATAAATTAAAPAATTA